MSGSSTRYRFGPWRLSPARRRLWKGGEPVDLIPRYFDLLRLLIDERGRVVGRGEIFDRVWDDVVVSDGALSQAVRTLRRTLGDDPRRPRYIRTVSRTGYQFTHDVVEEDDAAPAPAAASGRDAGDEPAPGPAVTADDAAAGPEADDGDPAGMVLQAARLAAARWGGAAAGGAAAGALAGLLQGSLFALLDAAAMPPARVLVVSALGAVVGGIGAAGVGAGLAAVEVAASRARWLLLAAGGAVAGGLTGLLATGLGRLVLEDMFGRSLAGVGGGVEGLALGAGAGLGYGLATRGLRDGGMAAPRGPARVRVATISGLACALAAALLGAGGGHGAGLSLDLLARRNPAAVSPLRPLSRALGRSDPGRLGGALQGGFEGLLFGAGLAAGLTRRPRRGSRP